MRAFGGSFLLALGGAVFLAAGAAMAAEPPPAIRLRLPFTDMFPQDHTAIFQSHPSGSCRINGEQAERFERRTSDPCLAANTSPGSECFDRLGLGTLRSQRTLVPYDGDRQCLK
jgi:hypothetical protein